MLVQASPWYAHALQRTVTGLGQALAAPSRMEWTTRPGSGPGAEILGLGPHRKRVLELGCGPGHNAACLAIRHRARVTGVDLVGLQIRRARAYYGRLRDVTFVAGHALHYLQATDEQFDAIYSVFGAVGLVAPELLLPAVARHLESGRTLVFSVPHPRRFGGQPPLDDQPQQDFVTLPDGTRLPTPRWDFDADRWKTHLDRAGLGLTSAQEFYNVPDSPWPTTLLITACKL